MMKTTCIRPRYLDDFISKINAILAQLRGYRNNYFGVTDELFLTDADIVEIKEEEED